MTETRETPSPPGGEDESRDRVARSPRGGSRVDGALTLGPRIALFYRQVIAELHKVIWPTRKELVTYTTVVIAFVLVVIMYVTILDFFASKLVLAVFG